MVIVYGSPLPQTICSKGSNDAEDDGLCPLVGFLIEYRVSPLIHLRSLLATLETMFVNHQIYDIFITRRGDMSLLDEIVL